VGCRRCPDCRKQVQKVPEPVYEADGLPWRLVDLCLDDKAAVPPDGMKCSWLVFVAPLRHALQSLERRRNNDLGDARVHTFGKPVTALGWPVDGVVAIHLLKNLTKERGYNQAGWMAEPPAAIQHRGVMPREIICCQKSRTRSGLTATRLRKMPEVRSMPAQRLCVGKTSRGWMRLPQPRQCLQQAPVTGMDAGCQIGFWIDAGAGLGVP